MSVSRELDFSIPCIDAKRGLSMGEVEASERDRIGRKRSIHALLGRLGRELGRRAGGRKEDRQSRRDGLKARRSTGEARTHVRFQISQLRSDVGWSLVFLPLVLDI